jgi:hypothetical protein
VLWRVDGDVRAGTQSEMSAGDSPSRPPSAAGTTPDGDLVETEVPRMEHQGILLKVRASASTSPQWALR